MFQSIYDTMIAGQRYVLILQGLGVTLLIAFCAIIIGTILGCILALMKISDNRILKGIGTLYTTVLRGLPLATQLIGHTAHDLLLCCVCPAAPAQALSCYPGIRPQLRSLLHRDFPCRNPGCGYRADRGRPLTGTFQAADPVQDYPSPGCKSSAPYLYQRVHRADQGDIGSQLYRSNGYDQGGRHDPQRNLQCLDSSSDLCNHLSYPDTGTYQGI